jgi:hypothetical protein
MRTGLVLTLLIFASVTFVSAQVTRDSVAIVPSGKGIGVPGSVSPDTVNQGNGIDYHGGSIMPGTPTVYLIWYGNWRGGPAPSDSPTTVSLVTNFLRNNSGSPYSMINSTYGDTNRDVTGLLKVGPSVKALTYPMGKTLSDASIAQIVTKVISTGMLPKDVNGIYFVMTTSDVDETSGFCSLYCGWHNHTSIAGSDIKYGFIGNPDSCPNTCEAQTVSPNNDSGGDAMIDILARQLDETVSDPDLNAWWNVQTGFENADQCAWKYGTLLGGSIGNGGYNETMNGVNYLIQMNWENARGGGCDNFLGGPFLTN